ncbi:YrdB family protein [Microbacterium sp.]|uniref:YrdB family protein n=1 Tax=Microbacterium sp. TaxID=51671 RepID=UPI0025FF8BAE|nr:YrdB family protein [Microbacterium sp.]
MADLPPVRPEMPAEPLPAGMRPSVDAVDAVTLLCELFAIGTLAVWGFTAWPFPWNIVVGIGAPVIAILLWALFVSPRAVVVVHPFIRALVELLVYASATIVWWTSGSPWAGLAFAAVAVAAGLITGRRRLA